jgi:hypothetical protein
MPGKNLVSLRDAKKMKPFKKILYNCHQATRLSLKRDEGTISFWERLTLAYHLAYCAPCRRFIHQWEFLAHRKSAQAIHSKPPYALSREARDRIQHQLDLLKS